MLIPKTETGNVGMVCGDCAKQRKADTNATAYEPEYFVGRFCLLRFPITVPAGPSEKKKPGTERMWVQVVGLAQDYGEELLGTLANDPVYATQFAFGDVVGFNRSEIQAVQE